MSAITAKASRKMKKYAVLTREPRCFLGSFDFSWEQRNFADVVQIERGGSPRPIDDYITDSQNGLNWVKIGDAPAQGHYITKTAEKIRPEGLSKTREVHPGDLILSNSMSFGKPYIMGIDGCIHDGWLLIRDTNSTFDLTFLCHLLGTPQMLDQYRSLAAGSTVNNLNKELVGNTVVTIPTIDEQRVLGQYLERLDNLITLHQRKCANLCSPSQVVFSLLFATSTFSWEQRKFGEVFMSLQNNTLSRAELNDEFGAAQNIHYGDVLIKYDEILDVSKEPLSYIEKQSIADKFKTSYLQNGDVIIADTAEDETVGKCTEIEGLTDQKVISGLHTMPVRPNRKFASGFLGFYLNSTAYHDQLKPLMQGIKVTSISKGAMQDTVVKFPLDLKEQEQIGIYFGGLDHLITLHQRECISFTGRADRLILTANKKRTTSSWEQRKLSEITDKVTEKNAGLQYVETFTNSAEFGIISQRDFFDHDIAKLGSLDGYYIVKNEDFVYNPRISTSAPVGPINRNKLGRTGVMSPLYTVFRPHDIDTTYLEYFFKCGYWHSFMNFNGDSGARSDRFSIRDNVFFQMPIPIPDIDEQRKIGELLTCLDNLITLHQRELEKLQNIKKSMLEKMFV